MKRNKLITVLLVTVSLLAVFVFSALSTDFFGLLQEKYVGLDEAEVVEKLRKMEYSELCGEINKFSSAGFKESDMIVLASILAEKIDAVSDERVIEDICNKKNSQILRVSLAQLCNSNNSQTALKDLSALEKVLFDKNEDSVVRRNLVWVFAENKASAEILTSLANDDDELLSFQAIKALNKLNPEAAQKIADSFLSDGTKGEKLRIAIKVKSREYKSLEATTTDMKDFIEFCKDIYYKNINDQLLTDTIVFALSDMRKEEAISFIIEEKSVEASIKSFCISQNYTLFLRLLKSDPSFETIELAISAMNIRPIDEVVHLLEEKIQNSDNKSNFTALKYDELIPADDKWAE